MYDVMRMNIKWFHVQVVFEGKDLVDANEDQPYAARPLDFYTRTKVAARCFCRPTAQAAFQKPSAAFWFGLPDSTPFVCFFSVVHAQSGWD